MNTSLPVKDDLQRTDAYQGRSNYSERKSRASYEAGEPRCELGIWLQAIRSFFLSRNHPFPESEQSTLLTRDWVNELLIARQALLHISQLTLRMVHLEGSGGPGSDQVIESRPGAPSIVDDTDEPARQQARRALLDLAESIGDICAICEALLETPRVGFYAWAGVGRILSRELDRSKIAVTIERESNSSMASRLSILLSENPKEANLPTDVLTEIQTIISDLARTLERLRIVDGFLKRDKPLKQSLPIFCLVYEESRLLLEYIDSRLLNGENLDRSVFDALDGMNYAMSMELRKVFARELVGLASLRRSPSIYARVENAHGLLRDCFQQSVVVVAQLLDPALDVAKLFDTFQTRLEQSLLLRKDLWDLLQLVKRAEQERDRQPISRLLERLKEFRDGSLRFLMYKDWEACERFMEEVGAARGAVEATPVVHRFGAYLETLFGQVNMRGVLVEHPFDFSDDES